MKKLLCFLALVLIGTPVIAYIDGYTSAATRTPADGSTLVLWMFVSYIIVYKK